MKVSSVNYQEKQQKSFGASLVYDSSVLRPSNLKKATLRRIKLIDRIQNDKLIKIKHDQLMLEDINEDELPTFIATIKKIGSNEPEKVLARSNECYFDGFIDLVARNLKKLNKQGQKAALK